MATVYNPLLGDGLDMTADAGTGTVDSVNAMTGVVVLTADSFDDTATTNKYTTAAEITKLANIEADADVNNISDADATDLTDAGDALIHFHSTDRNRTNHTGAQIISTVTGLQGALDGKETGLGNPGTDDYVLSSKIDGTRSWVVNVGGGGGAVDSVNTYTGTVVLDPDDLDDTSTTNKFTTAGDISKLSGIEAEAAVNAVDTVNTKTGSVVIDPDDLDDATTTNKFTTAGDISKLSGIEADADVNTVDTVNTKTGTVVINPDDLDDTSTTNKFTTAGDISKLSGIEADADVNNISNTDATDLTDAGESTLHYHAADRARADHTGSQATSTITGLDTALTGKQAASLAEYNVWVGNDSSVPTATDFTSPNVKDLVATVSPTTGAVTLSAANAEQLLTMTGAVTFSVSNFVDTYRMYINLEVTNPLAYTMTFPSGFVWLDGTEPDWTDDTWIIAFSSRDGGTSGFMAASGPF